MACECMRKQRHTDPCMRFAMLPVITDKKIGAHAPNGLCVPDSEVHTLQKLPCTPKTEVCALHDLSCTCPMNCVADG